MAKRRNKKQKQISALKRRLDLAIMQKQTNNIKTREPIQAENIKTAKTLQYKTPSSPKPKNNHTLKEKKKEDLFFYSPKLIKKDLKKTLILSFFFLLLILVLYFALEQNGLSYVTNLLPLK